MAPLGHSESTKGQDWFGNGSVTSWRQTITHDDVIKWQHFTRYWPFVRGIHRSPVNSPHKGQWRGALVFSLICAWIKGWVQNGEAGDLRCYRAHYDVIVMCTDVDKVPWCRMASFCHNVLTTNSNGLMGSCMGDYQKTDRDIRSLEQNFTRSLIK